MPETVPPSVLVFAGCNGSGNTTSAGILLPHYAGLEEFVNADTIARGLAAFNPEVMAVPAARIMLERLKELSLRRATFALVTTLSGKTYFSWLGRLRSKGYRFHLMYMWLSSPKLAVQRVAERVMRGGHHVPAETIRRRYKLSVRNFFRLYRPIADYWRLYDNSSADGYVMVATGSGSLETVLEPEIWSRILQSADDADHP